MQAVIVAVAALVAVFQVREALKLREDQARPFIVVDFDVSDLLLGPGLGDERVEPG